MRGTLLMHLRRSQGSDIGVGFHSKSLGESSYGVGCSIDMF
jgi:hypothetical protein